LKSHVFEVASFKGNPLIISKKIQYSTPILGRMAKEPSMYINQSFPHSPKKRFQSAFFTARPETSPTKNPRNDPHELLNISQDETSKEEDANEKPAIAQEIDRRTSQ